AAIRAALLRRLTTTLIFAARYEEASRNLNGLANTSGISPEGRWQAEWELASAMTLDGFAADALARVQGLLQADTIEQIPPALRLRMMWLEMKLSSDLQQSARVPGLADRLLAELGATPQEALSLEDRELIASNALLLRGRALLRQDADDQALETFASLREKFPRTEAAVLSYLEEARAYVDQGVFNEAQLSYRNIADDFPASEQAVIALYEGALAAEAQGQERNLREAINYLEELAVEAPEHELVFAARLRQGNIARKLGEFSLAQQIYENLIQAYQGSRDDLYLIELYRANTLFAQAGGDPERLLVTAAELESLFDLPETPLDFRSEVGYLRAQALRQAGSVSRAKTALWEVVSVSMPEEQISQQLGARGRIWLAKSLLLLADILQTEERSEEAEEVLQRLIAQRLPGWHLAQARLEQLLPSEG
ncbi:MAG: tetratricopeptide repeat protein, partial [Verrucomicrobiota bacterium]